jgi:hypothetical protein
MEVEQIQYGVPAGALFAFGFGFLCAAACVHHRGEAGSGNDGPPRSLHCRLYLTVSDERERVELFGAAAAAGCAPVLRGPGLCAVRCEARRASVKRDFLMLPPPRSFVSFVAVRWISHDTVTAVRGDRHARHRTCRPHGHTVTHTARRTLTDAERVREPDPGPDMSSCRHAHGALVACSHSYIVG